MEIYNTDTKTRYLKSGRIGAPTLEPTWGSLAKVLKIALVEGYNNQEISTITIDPILKKAKAKLALGHGYEVNDVITIRGATQEELNQDFRIIEVRPEEIEFFVHPSIEITEVTSSLGLTCKISPLGYSLVYESTSGGVMCFQNTSSQSKVILKVIDEIPPNGYLTAWVKYARVVMGKEIDENGEFIGEQKSPYSTLNPNIEKTGNGVLGAGGMHGYTKWDYDIPTVSSWAETSTTNRNTVNRSWRIIGDSNTFYISIGSSGGTTPMSSNLYGFGLFIAENPYETSNAALQSRVWASASNLSNAVGNFTRSDSSFPHLTYSSGNYLLSNAYGSLQNNYAYTCVGLGLSSSVPWREQNIAPTHPITGKLLTTKIGIFHEMIYRGEHRGVRVPYGDSNLTEETLTNNHDIVLTFRSPMSSSYTDTAPNPIPLIFSLKDWEEVP